MVADPSRFSWTALKRRDSVRKALVACALLAGVIITAVMVMASVWPTINRVETGRTVEYPHLMPKIYQLDYDRVYVEALSAAREQQDWLLTGEDRGKGVIMASTSMPITGWTHEITVEVIKRNAYVSRIHVISEGKDAPGDLGHNARLIEGYFETLDRRLGAADLNKTKPQKR